ncbi:hypothetical protein HYT25_00070 [Candidatus Pacearchaeota archaeon]|nr:hypothetical protein [Candidatus Pacearchaeota archaeon]
MAEIKIKVDIPEEFKEEFELALDKVVKQFVRAEKFKRFDEILKNSEMTDELALKLADELKKRVAKRHGL